MTMLRKSNEKTAFSEHFADLALVNLDPAVRAITETSQRWDESADANAEADYDRKVRANKEIQEESALLAQLERSRNEPNHTKESKATLDKRIEAQSAKVDRLMQRSKAAKANVKTSVARMDTSRMLKAVEKAGFRPHRLIAVDVPKEYTGTDTLTAIETIREHIAELHEREGALYRAYLPREEAKERAFRDVKKNSQRAESFPLKEYAVVRTGHDGRMFQGNVEFPQALFFQAIETFVCAYFEDRIDKMYDGLEAAGEFESVEFLSMAERRREHAALKAELDKLERIEGALLRKAYMEGHEPHVRADMDVRNLIPLEIDPAVEFEAPKGGFTEVAADASAAFAQRVN